MTGQTYDYKPKFPEVLKMNAPPPWPPEKVEEYKQKIRENRELIMTEIRAPYRVGPEPDRMIDIPVFENNMTVSMGNQQWHFYREKPFTWLQVRLLRFCLGLTVSKNGT